MIFPSYPFSALRVPLRPKALAALVCASLVTLLGTGSAHARPVLVGPDGTAEPIRCLEPGDTVTLEADISLALSANASGLMPQPSYLWHQEDGQPPIAIGSSGSTTYPSTTASNRESTLTISENMGTGYYRAAWSGTFLYTGTGTYQTETGVSNRIFVEFGESFGWQHELQADIANVAGDVVTNPNTGQVFYRGNDNRMWNYWWDGKTWVAVPLSWNVTNVAGDVATTTTGSNVFYRGTDGRLWNFYYDNGWHNDVLDWGVTNVSGAIVHDGNDRVYYRGTDNRLHHFEWNNGWHHGNLGGTGGPANVGDSIDPDGSGKV